MKVIILNEGIHFQASKYLNSIKNASEIQILQFTPRQYEKEIYKTISSLNPSAKVSYVNKDLLVNFSKLQKEFVQCSKNLGDVLTIDNRPLYNSLKQSGLNLWWCSGFIESTSLKWDLLKNFYYLSIIKKVISSNSRLIANFSSLDLLKDLQSICLSIPNCTIVNNPQTKPLKPLRNIAQFFFNLLSTLFLKSIFSFIYKSTMPKNCNLFFSFYPNQICIRNKDPVAKIYGDLPEKMSQKNSNKSIHLTYFSPQEIFNLKKLCFDLKEFRKNKFQIIPTLSQISFIEILKVYFNPRGYLSYRKIIKNEKNIENFKIGQVSLKNTFQAVLQKSLYGQITRENVLFYLSSKNILKKPHTPKIAFTFVEFHSWETSVMQAFKDSQEKSPLIAIQQSAPDPTLTSYYFSKEVFEKKQDPYPLPDLLLCAGKAYSDSFKKYISHNSEKILIDFIGHLTADYKKKISNKDKDFLRGEELIQNDRKICFIPCSLEYELCVGVFLLVYQIAKKRQDIHFLIKPHPNVEIKKILKTYNILSHENVTITERIVPQLLPIVDFCVSTCTSVSLEAMTLQIPQAHLDISGLPKKDSLHYMEDLIQDIKELDDFLMFLEKPENYKLRDIDRTNFIGDENKKPIEEAMNKISTLLESFKSID